ncbi:MAG TPA: carboxypeptidase regulatory-like domain-containing protein [Terriglobia bacterium]|nr:carboxypeptidase regulatory-like domain-containing protein [Terriglobia bacterium]
MTCSDSRAARAYVTVISLLLLPIFFFFLFPAKTLAQSTTTGAIAGQIIDPSRAVVPNATVTLKNMETGAPRTATTGSNGTYHFAFLEPGNYTVSATASGFQTTIRPVTVTVGQTITADIELQVGLSRQSVTVTSETPLVQTTNGNIATTINQLQISQIPNPGNDMTFIAQMSPGAVMNTGAGYGHISLYGLPATSNVFTVNGMNDMDPLFNVNNSGATDLMLGQNDIREVTVVTNGYSGEYGSLAGANINYVTKSGANAFHGNANYFWNGRALDANSFFNNATNTPRPFVNANQWSASLGGPIVKDKAFFFVDQEGLRLLIPTSTQARIPSPQFENATIANLQNLGLNASVPFYNDIFSLYNNAPGASRAKPLIDCGSAGITDLSASDPCVLAFRSTAGQLTDQWTLASRLDFNLGPNDRLFIHGEMDRGNQASFTDPISPLFNLVSNQPEEQGQIGWTHLLGTNKVNSFRGTLQYYSAIFSAPDLNKALQAFPSTLYFYDGALTTLGGEDSIAPSGSNVTQYQFVDDFSWIHGNHNLKFGMNYYRSDISDYSFGYLSSGFLGLFSNVGGSSLPAFYNGGVAPDYSAGDLLDKVFPTSLVQPFALYRLGFYAQDEWRVTPGLQLTLALRADHSSNPVCQHNCFARTAQPFPSLNHDASIPYNQAILTGQHQEFAGMTNLAWQPRFGFAWQPFGIQDRFVVRGGIGLFYDGIPARTVESIAGNPPYQNGFVAYYDNISPAETYNLFSDAANSNSAFLSGFANGGTLGSITDSLAALYQNFSPPNLASAAPIIHLPQYQEWNLQIQKGFGLHTILSLGYVGNHGIHEMIPNASINGYAANFAGMPPTPPDPRFATVTYLESAGVSSYNGMTLSFRHNFSRGLVTANYTYGHALDTLSNGGSGLPFIYDTNVSNVSPQNPYNIRDNYGNADYDNRHSLNLAYVYDIPIKTFLFGHGRNALVKGWQVSGTIFTHSGFPYTVVDGNAEGALSYQGFGGPIFASVNSPAPLIPCNSPDRPCLTPSQFQPSTSTPTQFGVQGRNRFRGPGYFNTDLGISKITSLPHWESAKLSLGFQFFNVLNHPNFDQPIANLGNSQFGQIISTVSPPTSIFGAGLGADASPRLIQVRATLSF